MKMQPEKVKFNKLCITTIFFSGKPGGDWGGGRKEKNEVVKGRVHVTSNYIKYLSTKDKCEYEQKGEIHSGVFIVHFHIFFSG